ncbi:hypothetical protein CDL15_Pgr015592 [Punica granatum]|uniref:Uncharacterized protein n=1 Tax=Punica granatum TaxID=22663 RepID=A0A218XNJ3_PUNGR|nr:hypothetical protein CDL15_Pgr015592 [Punica granatum]
MDILKAPPALEVTAEVMVEVETEVEVNASAAVGTKVAGLKSRNMELASIGPVVMVTVTRVAVESVHHMLDLAN